jgi:hypothetical protein
VDDGRATRDNGTVTHAIGVRQGERHQARLSVEGRPCTVRAHPASGLGTASGLVAIADSTRGIQEAFSWMPGRILVLTDEAADANILIELLGDPQVGGFAAIVLLPGQVDVTSAPRQHAEVPIVLVNRPQDQECVRRAVRVTLEVHDRSEQGVGIPEPRHLRRRHPRARRSTEQGHRMPGTIDLRDD